MSFLLDVLKSIAFGCVQGISAWLPISSRAHLILLQSLWPIMPEWYYRMFLVFVSTGSAFAILVLFYRQLFLKRSIFRIWKSIVLASLPILGFGMLLSYWIESVMSAKFVVAILLIAYGIILIGYAKHPVRAKYHSFYELGANEAVQFGLVQSLALFPGTSWLASGLLGGRFLKLERKASLLFSYLVSACSIVALNLFQFSMFFKDGYPLSFFQGFCGLLSAVCSFIVGIFIVRWWMRVFGEQSLRWAGFYRIALGLFMIVFFYIF